MALLDSHGARSNPFADALCIRCNIKFFAGCDIRIARSHFDNPLKLLIWLIEIVLQTDI